MRLSQITSEAVKSAVKEPETLTVELADGERGTIDSQDLNEVMQTGGRVVSQEELQRESEFAEAGEKPLLAGALAALRGGTLGLSDVAIKESGLLSEQELQDLSAANPVSSTFGEIGGAVAPILLSGGTGVVGSLARMAPSAIVEQAGAKLGAKAAGKFLSSTTSKVVENAVKTSIGSAVEGAAYGAGKLLSEDALGNAEFNAESLMANVGEGAFLGGLTGGAFSLLSSGSSALYGKAKESIGGSTKRKIQQTILNNIDGDEAFKMEVAEKIKNDIAIEDGLLALKDPEIQAIKARNPDAPITKGMESAIKPIKNVENYLFDSPTADGEAIRKAAQDVVNYVEKTVDDIWTGAKQATPEESGELIKQTFISSINAPRQSGQAFYADLMNEFGGVPVQVPHRTKVLNKLKSSDLYRIGGEGAEVKRIINILGDNQDLTLRQLKILQQDIGAAKAKVIGAERQLLGELYDDIRSLQDNAIRTAVGNTKAGKAIIRGLDAANADYQIAYKAKEEIADLFGVKGRDFDDVLEKIQNMSYVDLDKKFLNLKKSDKAYEILQKYPEIGKLVLASRQKDLLNKHLLQGGDINYSGLKSTISKMNESEALLYFGGDKASKQKFLDALTLYEKRPKTLNPSGTDIRKELREMISPKAIMGNWMLGQIYKGNESFIGKTVNELIPSLSGIEKASNTSKNKISDAIDEFFKSGAKTINASQKAAVKTMTGMDVKDEKEIDDKISFYSQNPAAITEKFANANKALINSAPKTSQALQNRLVAGAEFLMTKVPKKDASPFNDTEVSKSDKMRFKNYVEAVENPFKVIDLMKFGYFTPESGEAIKVVYPQLFSAIKEEIMQRLPEFKNITEKQKADISRIFNLDAKKAYTPQGFAILQGYSAKALKESEAPATKKVPVAAMRSVKAADRVQTGLDRSIYR